MGLGPFVASLPPSVDKAGMELKGTRVEQNFLQKSLGILPWGMDFQEPEGLGSGHGANREDV